MWISGAAGSGTATAGDPATGAGRGQQTDQPLREVQVVGHVEIERRAEAGTEIVQNRNAATNHSVRERNAATGILLALAEALS